MIGSLASHYRIIEVLGRGGMGIVYKAQDTRLGRVVALKFLPASFAGDAISLDRFRREARTASALNHPGICTIHDIDECEGQPFIVMEFLEGRSLRDRIAGGPLQVDEALELSIQIADALDTAHCRGVIHRDIKSANIFLTQRGQAKILDFGLAKETFRGVPDSTGDALADTVRCVTRPGTVMGTVEYMSPEQAMGEDLDRRTDLFSLGVVMYEMMTGVLPFKGTTAAAIFNSILNREPVAPLELRPELPPGLQQIIIEALRKERKNRYQTARQIREDLEAVKNSPGRMLRSHSSDAWQASPSVAVLPFANVSPEREREYFSDGLAEDLINALAKVPGLRVASRTSSFRFRGGDADIRDIGRQLNVSTVLEGSVRSSGDRVRITAQLVSVADGYQIWSERYERDMRDVFAVQDEISHAIVETLKIKLAERKRLVETATADMEAYHLYLKGRYHANKRNAESLKKAIESFHQAIARDPNYALAYSGLAECYVLTSMHAPIPPNQVWPKARAAATRALALDESLAAAHSSLGSILSSYEWNWVEAEREFKRAIELNPGFATAHMAYATNYLNPMGRLDEAIAEIKVALELEPLSLIAHSTLAGTLHHARRFDAAIEELDKAIELDPTFYFAHWSIGRAYVCTGQFEKADEAFRKAIQLSGGVPITLGSLANLRVLSGQREEGLKVFENLVEVSKTMYVPSILLAAIQAVAGNVDAAFEWLEKACEERCPWMVWLRHEVSFESMHSDPRFAALLQKIGLQQNSAV